MVESDAADAADDSDDRRGERRPPSPSSSPTSRRPSRRRRCSFVVTGFGPFRGVPDNPTSTLVRRLRERIGADECDASTEVDVRETRIIETSAESVREEIDAIYERVKEQQQKEEEVAAVVIVHLGVNYGGTCFRIERCAYNDATFRIPDERGYMPDGVRILGESSGDGECAPEFGRCSATSLDVDELRRTLANENRRFQDADSIYDVEVSTDPGRFVCNFTYYLSLERCRASSASMSSASTDGTNRDGAAPPPTKDFGAADTATLHSLFVHIPPFLVTSEDRQLEFVWDLLRAVERQVCAVADD